MTRALVILALLGAWSGCGTSASAPAAEAAPARPVRVADHVTEDEPEPETVAVAAGPEDESGPHADPPPVEPPAE